MQSIYMPDDSKFRFFFPLILFSCSKGIRQATACSSLLLGILSQLETIAIKHTVGWVCVFKIP